jgi:hypothetical protein
MLAIKMSQGNLIREGGLIQLAEDRFSGGLVNTV